MRYHSRVCYRSLAGLGACLLFLLTLSLPAQVFPPMSDPLFGIEFDPQQKHFEIAPQTLTRRCHSLRGKSFWIFAHYESAGTNYYILNGYQRYRPDGPQTGPPSYEPGSGVAVIVSTSKCKVVSAEEFMSTPTQSATSPGGTQYVSEESLTGLASDAVTRMVSAFGGKQQFKAELAHAVAAHDSYEATLPQALRSDYPAVIRKQITDVLSQ